MVINKYTDDATIIVKFREGDEDAFNAIVKRFYDDVLNLSYFLLFDEKRAKEFTKKLFYDIYFNRNIFNLNEEIRNNIIKICWRRFRKINIKKYADISFSLKNGKTPLEGNLIFSLCRLDSNERFLLYLKNCLKYDYIKISNLLETRVEKIKKIYTKILVKIKNNMDKYLNENYKEIKLHDDQSQYKKIFCR